MRGNCDPQGGEKCFKDGATTGVTVGRVGRVEVHQFVKGRADCVDLKGGSIATDQIDTAKVYILHPDPITRNEGPVVDSGDSGAAVFRPVEEVDGWNWVGQVVSRYNNSPPVAFMIPQSQILSSIKERTQREWQLSTGDVLS
jgi:hypothetical protein